MNTLKIFSTGLLLIFLTSLSFSQIDGLSEKKMKETTKQILEIFKDSKAGNLKDYISDEWIDKKNINLKKYKINNYTPEEFEVLVASGDLCVATIGGKSWKHLVAFRFTEEYGKYKVIPKGISESSSDYVDPWWFVKDYVCNDFEKEEK